MNAKIACHLCFVYACVVTGLKNSPRIKNLYLSWSFLSMSITLALPTLEKSSSLKERFFSPVNGSEPVQWKEVVAWQGRMYTALSRIGGCKDRHTKTSLVVYQKTTIVISMYE